MSPGGEKGIALVTGGATGIGRACCELLAEEGFSVGIHFHKSSESAQELVNELPGAFSIQADISLFEGVEKIQKEISKRGLLSVLVNNAGITRDGYMFTSTVADLGAVLDVNLRAPWYLTKSLALMMIRQKRGRVINISSVVGHTGNTGQTIYGMSKAALDSFTKSAARELAPHGILVNSVAPGFIDTEMTRGLEQDAKQNLLAKIPLARMGTPLEVAEVVRFLATRGSYCTGSVFHVNGGMYGG